VLCYSIVKNLFPVLKNANGSCLQDGVENVYIFTQYFQKLYFCPFFFCFFFNILGKNKTFIENYFLKFKMAELINMKDDIFQKRFYISTTGG
jgi:hypothetical protein